MPNLLDKNNITLDQATDSKSLKKRSVEELERMLDTLLTTEQDNDSTVNTIIAELMKRGVSKKEINEKTSKGDEKKEDKIKKAFDVLGLDVIEKSLNKDDVAAVAKTIKYGPDYGRCFIRKNGNDIFWMSSDGDGEKGTDDSKIIREKFSKIKGVKTIFIEAESQPKPKENWEEVIFK